MIDRKAVLEIMLFNKFLNSFNYIGIVEEVRILYFYINMVLIK